MHPQQFVLGSKLVPPRVKAQCLRRERLEQLFLQVIDYPVTVVQADAGYGKSTTLVTHLCSRYDHIAWYTVEKGERDTFLFLHYLIQALKSIDERIGERSLRLMQEADAMAAILQPCLTLLLNDLNELAPDPTLLVLDDFHAVSDVGEIEAILDLLVRYLPVHVHLVIGTRKALEFPVLQRMQTTFDLLQIGKQELAFTQEEVELLFQKEYGIVLAKEQAAELQEQTEGWIIALQMVWKGLERGIEWSHLWRAQPEQAETGQRLFHYLAEEVFDRQPDAIQAFMQRTCILETMEADVCDLLLQNGGATQSEAARLLATLERSGLFVTGTGTGDYRYHRLFRRFLRTRTQAALGEGEWADLHRRAALFYLQKNQLQQALVHQYQTGDLPGLVDMLMQAGDDMLQQGRLDMMRRWIALLPSDVLEQHPKLLYWRGEIERLSSRFNEAAHWYNLAEGAYIRRGDNLGRSRVYRGQAQVYLDTIQPNKAVQWLQKAVQILGDDHPQETAKILRLLAENHTNSGNLQEAIALVARANQLTDAAPRDELDIRILLRTGRLQQAKEMTRGILAGEVKRVPKSHREMHLLHSLIDAFLGERDSSAYHARQGIATGQKLRSPFVEAVGYMRLGHALALSDRLDEAQSCYRRSMEMSGALHVERGKVEALMGLCLTSGLRGELEQADRYGRQGLELALGVHDLWCANLLRLSLGAIRTMWGQDEEALPWLLEAADGFLACGDSFLSANVLLWLSILYHRQGDRDAFQRTVCDLLAAVETHGLEELFCKRTLFGPHDLQTTVPFLLEARDGLQLAAADRMLRRLECKGLTKHPGYTLRICTLGDFTVYRGLEEIERKEWKREKSRQLFQLLLTRQGQLVQRDEIYDLLWPDGDEKTANRDFKVAMNALANALEPNREARAESFFIERVESAYRLLQHPAVQIDAHVFKELAEKGLTASDGSEQAMRDLEAALHLYRGDFLQHQPYLDWCLDERERLRTLYLRALERLAELHLEAGAAQEAITCCETLLTCDPCWEAAYRILMTAYHQLGNRSLVMAAYKKCVNHLQEQLALTPMDATTKLYQRYVRSARPAVGSSV